MVVGAAVTRMCCLLPKQVKPHFRGQLQMCVAVGKSSCCERMRYVETVLEVCLEAESL